jgi:hypothetical protein
MDWSNIPENIDDYFGIVYHIERLNALPGEARHYWGCKMLHKTIKRPPLKGTKRKRKSVVSSDWQTYYGSSERLKADVLLYGEENFKRTIVKLCSCKWQLKYEEMLIQVNEKVLFRDDCYNSIINVRIGSVPKDLVEYYKNQ